MIRVDVALKLGEFDLDVAFENGAGITALFGRSGSGKSMTINLIAGLKRPDRGSIVLDGRVLVDTEAHIFVPAYRRRVGLVFQDAQLFPHLSVRQNLLFGRWFAPKAAASIPFAQVVETLGIGHLLERKPARLSGGEKQRVAMGRALLASPEILLMDEPLASLDTERKLEILPLIESLRDNLRIPIVYVSHAIEEVARLASRVVVLDNGHVVAAGHGRRRPGTRPERYRVEPLRPVFGRDRQACRGRCRLRPHRDLAPGRHDLAHRPRRPDRPRGARGHQGHRHHARQDAPAKSQRAHHACRHDRRHRGGRRWAARRRLHRPRWAWPSFRIGDAQGHR